MSATFSPAEEPRYAGLDLLATAVLLLDGGRHICYANAAAENLFALSRKQLLGRLVDRVFNDAERLGHALDQAVRQRGAYTEQEIELSINGRLRLHLSCTVTPLEMDDGELLLEFRQIDQQIKIAREERQLEQAQANRELIRNLAHEIKNPLGGIRGAAQLLESELSSPQQTEYTQVIISEADRLQSLVNRLLTPHRLPAYARVNIHEILARVKSLLDAEFRDYVAVNCDFDISLPDLECDPEQILQTVLNIARNAAEATREGPNRGGKVCIKTRVARGVTLARRRYRLALAISVIDNGPGIPPTLQERIFFPLVSGREGGSGLGLTIAQTFVAQHHGAIECESEPGRTIFTIMLPLDPGSARNGPTAL
ncbi:MAG: nitrogen regulation protein NR(II) [Betaproteobacteria bacterium]